jgi:hypothetical protein
MGRHPEGERAVIRRMFVVAEPPGVIGVTVALW